MHCTGKFLASELTAHKDIPRSNKHRLPLVTLPIGLGALHTQPLGILLTSTILEETVPLPLAFENEYTEPIGFLEGGGRNLRNAKLSVIMQFAWFRLGITTLKKKAKCNFPAIITPICIATDRVPARPLPLGC